MACREIDTGRLVWFAVRFPLLLSKVEAQHIPERNARAAVGDGLTFQFQPYAGVKVFFPLFSFSRPSSIFFAPSSVISP